MAEQRLDIKAADAMWSFLLDDDIGATVTRDGMQVGHVSAEDLFSTAFPPGAVDGSDPAEIAVQLLERDCSQRAGGAVRFPRREELRGRIGQWLDQSVQERNG
jgi:hypothetical protein